MSCRDSHWVEKKNFYGSVLVGIEFFVESASHWLTFFDAFIMAGPGLQILTSQHSLLKYVPFSDRVSNEVNF